MSNRMLVAALSGVLAVGAGCEMMGRGGSSSGGGSGSAQSGSSGKMADARSGNPDALFMTETAHMSHAEIAAGQLALKKATNPQVKQFAQQMITDHTQGNQQLMAVAKQKGVDLPKRPDELHTKGAAAMANMSGADFDREYMSCMTSDHAKLLSSVEDKAATAKDPDVRSFAAAQVPIVRHHYQMALELNRSLGGGATGGGMSGGSMTGRATTDGRATGGGTSTGAAGAAGTR
jgi:putative membrane protein